MSTSTSAKTISLPAHILDAHITPRAREVLMLLASQTSPQEPAVWICQAAIAQRLRCSAATVARAIQKLIEAKLLAETGQLHQGRYKFYHVRWSCDENVKALSKKFTKPIRKVEQPKTAPKPATTPFEGVQLILPPVIEAEAEVAPVPAAAVARSPMPPPTTVLPPPTLTPIIAINDSRIAYYAEVARKKHLENYRQHQSTIAQYDRGYARHPLRGTERVPHVPARGSGLISEPRVEALAPERGERIF